MWEAVFFYFWLEEKKIPRHPCVCASLQVCFGTWSFRVLNRQSCATFPLPVSKCKSLVGCGSKSRSLSFWLVGLAQNSMVPDQMGQTGNSKPDPSPHIVFCVSNYRAAMFVFLIKYSMRECGQMVSTLTTHLSVCVCVCVHQTVGSFPPKVSTKRFNTKWFLSDHMHSLISPLHLPPTTATVQLAIYSK